MKQKISGTRQALLHKKRKEPEESITQGHFPLKRNLAKIHRKEPQWLSTGEVITLQRSVGNHAIQRILSRDKPLFHKKSLQLQQSIQSPSKQTGAWNNLPNEAKKILINSYNILHSEDGNEFWIWNKPECWSTESCFNRLERDRQQAFLDVFTSLKRQGLHIWIDHVIEFHPENTRGITFAPTNREGLKKALDNQKFCTDAWYGGGSKENPKWREVVPTGTEGLHIIIPPSGPCGIHIDSISPVEGRETSGQCNYDVMTGIKHWIKEEKGWFKNKKKRSP